METITTTVGLGEYVGQLVNQVSSLLSLDTWQGAIMLCLVVGNTAIDIVFSLLRR